MDDGSWLSVAALILLLIGAIYFAAAETAFASVSRARLRARQEKGEARAKRALWITENFERAITTILICTNIVHLSAASIVTVIVTRKWGEAAVVWGTIVTTLVLFYFGEMLPKSIAKRYSERCCLGTADSLYFFMRIFAPLAAVLTGIGQAAAKLTKGDVVVSVTEDELYDIIEDMTDAGTLDEEQGDLVQSALEFGDITVEHVLTARVDMAAADMSWPLERLLDFTRSIRHSRIPVYDGSIDNIVGVLQIRKFMKAWLADGDTLELRSILDKPYFVPATTKVDDLLPVMSRERLNMAVVTDTWGGTLGIVTVEDILEELVGEIWDEEDEVEEFFRALGGGRYELDARLDVQEALELLGFEDSGDDEELYHKSLSEWTLEHFELMPAQGDTFEYNGWLFTISEVSQRRIRKLEACETPAVVSGGGEEV